MPYLTPYNSVSGDHAKDIERIIRAINNQALLVISRYGTPKHKLSVSVRAAAHRGGFTAADASRFHTLAGQPGTPEADAIVAEGIALSNGPKGPCFTFPLKEPL
jgi:hypothetical protein